MGSQANFLPTDFTIIIAPGSLLYSSHYYQVAQAALACTPTLDGGPTGAEFHLSLFGIGELRSAEQACLASQWFHRFPFYGKPPLLANAMEALCGEAAEKRAEGSLTRCAETGSKWPRAEALPLNCVCQTKSRVCSSPLQEGGKIPV
uniref:Uncharacterized protein n=1 Tax=Sphaerodactylus townsendi TaxID=933632 RepID=A0ACB8ES59_9SAUR